MNKSSVSKIPEIAAAIIAVILILYVFSLMLPYIVFAPPIEIGRIRNAQHIEEFESVFKIELAENESLSVAMFSPGALQAGLMLNVFIEGVESPEDFLSRFRGDFWETEVTFHIPPPDSELYDSVYRIGIVNHDNLWKPAEHSSLLYFYRDGEYTRAEFHVSDASFPREFEAVGIILMDKYYYQSVMSHPAIITPILLATALIIFAAIRVWRRWKTGTPQNMPDMH